MDYDEDFQILIDRIETLEQDSIRLNELSEIQYLKIVALEDLAYSNRKDLGANSRGSLVFIGGIIVMLLIGSQFSIRDGYSYRLDAELLTTILGLPALAGLITAAFPALKDKLQG